MAQNIKRVPKGDPSSRGGEFAKKDRSESGRIDDLDMSEDRRVEEHRDRLRKRGHSEEEVERRATNYGRALDSDKEAENNVFKSPEEKIRDRMNSPEWAQVSRDEQADF